MSEDLIIRFLGIDMVSTAANRAGFAVERLADRSQGANARTAGSWMSAGMAMMQTGIAVGFITAGIIGVGIHSALAAAQFQSDMVLLHTHANAASGDIKTLTDFVLGLAPAVGIGPDELAQGLYRIESITTSLPPNMRNVATAEDMLTQSARLAQIGHANLEDTTTALSSVMATYAKDNVTASQAAGILNITVGEGNIRLQELVAALGTGILPVAEQAGVKLQSLGAAVATLTDLGIPATRATTYLRSAIIQMTEPSGPAEKALTAIGLGAEESGVRMAGFSDVLAKAGVNQSQVAEELRKTGSLDDTIQMLKDHLTAAGLSGEQAGALLARAFGGIRSGTGIIALTDNLASLHQKELDATAGSREFGQTWEYFKANDPHFIFQRLTAAFQVLEIQLGTALIPLIKRFTDVVIPLMTQIGDWIHKHEALVRQIFTFVAVGGLALSVILTFGGALIFAAGGAMLLLGPVLALFAPLFSIGGAIAGAVGPLVGMIPWLFRMAMVLPQLISLLPALGAVLMEGLGAALVGLLPAIAGFLITLALIGVVIGVIVLAWKPLVATLQHVGAVLIPAVTNAFRHFKEGWDPLQILAGFLMDLGMKGSTVFAIFRAGWIIWNTVVAAVKDVVKWIQALIAEVSKNKDMQEALNEASKVWAEVAPLIIPILAIIGVILGALLSGVFHALIGFLVNAIPAAVQVFVGAFQLIAGIILIVKAVFWDFGVFLWDLFHGKWGKLKDDALQIWTDLSHGLIDITEGLWNMVWGIFKFVVGGIYGLIAGFVVGVVGFFQWLSDQLVGHSVIPDMVNSIITWFTQLPGQVLGLIQGFVNSAFDTFNSLAVRMVEIGRNIVDGLKQGLVNGWNGLLSLASTLSDNLMSSIKRSLGIASPSWVAAEEVGVPIAQGIALGITGGFGPPGSGSGVSGAVGGVASAAVGLGSQVGNSLTTQFKYDLVPVTDQLKAILEQLKQEIVQAKDLQQDLDNRLQMVVEAELRAAQQIAQAVISGDRSVAATLTDALRAV